jgi:hypothetical protein
MLKKDRLAILLIGFLLLAGVFVAAGLTIAPTKVTIHSIKPTALPPITQQSNYFSYPGQEGKDALTLLKQKTTVSQNTSGLVTMINERKADESKHEYWAFYVNGKYAQVGPAQYKTKNSDKIEWKIEKY